MTLFLFDIRTVLSLLFIANLLTAGVLLAYSGGRTHERRHRYFLLAKLFQAAAWGLLALRGEIPLLVSADGAAVLMFPGLAWELLAITLTTERDRRLEHRFALAALVCVLLFCVFGETASQRVLVGSVGCIGLFALAAWVMLQTPDASLLRRLVGWLYLFFCGVLAFRAVTAGLSDGHFDLLSRHLAQTLAFALFYLITLGGGIGFILLLKERDDQALAQAHRELIEHGAMLQDIFDTSSVAIFLMDPEGRITHANQRMADLFGVDLEALMGRRYADFLPPEALEDYQCALHAVLAGRCPSFELERRHRRLDGGQFWGHLTGRQLRGAAGGEMDIVAVLVDVSARREVEERTRHLANHDALTGLANRSLFSERLRQAIEVAERDRRSRFAVLYLDLDHFKGINDTLGHLFGDQLLEEAARRIRGCIRASDTAARLGGDEFAVLLSTNEPGRGAVVVADKIRAALGQPYHIEGVELEVTASVGVAVHPDDGRDEVALVRAADHAMYLAKRTRREARHFRSERTKASRA